MTLPSKPAAKSRACVGACASVASAVTGIIVANTGLPPEFAAPVVLPLVGALVSSLYSLWGSLTRDTIIGSLF